MDSSKPEASDQNRLYVSTKEYAVGELVKPQTVFKRYSQTGTYFGVKPIKLKNGRLAWPNNRGAK